MSGMFVPPFRAWELLCQEGEERDLCGYLCAHTHRHTHAHKQIVFECVFWLCLWDPVATGHCKKRRERGFTYKWSASWSLLLFWFHENPSSHMVLVSLIHRRTETHCNGLEFKTLFSHCLAPLFPVLHSGAPAPALPLVPTPHSPCPWDTPFIYFLLNFSALRDSFPAVPGGTESTLGVSQGLAGVERDARGKNLGVGSGC